MTSVNTESDVLKGRYRGYLPSNLYFLKRIGRLRTVDYLVAILIGVSCYSYLNKCGTSWNDALMGNEEELWNSLVNFRNQNFHLYSMPPFGLILLNFISQDVAELRKVSLIFACLFLAFTYLILRRINTSFLVSIMIPLLMQRQSIFQTQAQMLSLDTMNWFLLSCIYLTWRTMKVKSRFGKCWTFNLFALAVSSGLAMSTKYLGIFSWLWIFILFSIDFWNVIGDCEISALSITKYVTYFFGTHLAIPTLIFLLSNAVMFQSWKNDDIAYSTFMSLEFKSMLRGPLQTSDKLYYGSAITLRHLESLGGYLHSHNYMYETGSHGQQVALSQDETDDNNLWIVEHQVTDFDIVNRTVAVANNDFVRLRHVNTGKLLRASSAKPPVSEEDYTREVSCTGDENYSGDTDELWKLVVDNASPHDLLKPHKSVIRFQNNGHRCSIVAHDLRLPKMDFTAQEVMCLDPATHSRTLFKIESVKNERLQPEQLTTYTFDNANIFCYYFNLLIEYIQRQYKYDYYIKNYGIETDYTPESWPIINSGEFFSDQVWMASILGITIWIMYCIISFFRWNPWTAENNKPIPVQKIMFGDATTELFIGWVLHYFPFFKCLHKNLPVTLYFESFYFGLLIAAAQLQYLQRVSKLLFLIPVAWIIYSFTLELDLDCLLK